MIIVNNKDDWLIAKQKEAGQDSLMENSGKRKGRVRELMTNAGKQDKYVTLRKGIKPHG